MNKEYLKLYSTVLVVRGEKKGVLYNFTSTPYVLPIPNILISILDDCDSMPLDVVKKRYCSSVRDFYIFNKYIDFLKKSKCIFFTDAPHRFSKIDLDYHSNSFIENSIVEYCFSNYDIYEVFNQLNILLCKHIELRLLSTDKVDNVIDLVKNLSLYKFRSVDIILSFNNQKIVDYLLLLKSHVEYKFIRRIIFDDASYYRDCYTGNVYNKFENSHKFLFSHVINLKYICEAMNFNPYYNKKVCIDKNGCVKNFIKQSKYFGNVQSLGIKEILENTSIKKLWNISHDKIVQIRNDEYRYSYYLPYELKMFNDDLYYIDTSKTVF